jgi:hypothetical protein
MKEILVGIDGQPDEVVESNESVYLHLANGQHTITVTAVDRAGNTYTVFRSFTVDAQATTYYGLLTVGGILVVLVVAVAAFMLLRQRKGGTTATTVPEHELGAQLP